MQAQSWLFDDELDADKDRVGISRWPLISVFHPTGLTAPSGGEEDPADAGFGGRFAAADQHAHLVKEVLELDGHSIVLEDWHHGGDTARVQVGGAGGAGWVLLVDLERMQGMECLVVALTDADAAAAVETAAEAAARAGAGAADGDAGGKSSNNNYVSTLTQALSAS